VWCQYLPRNVASVTAAGRSNPVHSYRDGKGLKEGRTENNRAVILSDGDICTRVERDVIARGINSQGELCYRF